MNPRDLPLDPEIFRWLERIDELSTDLPDLGAPASPAGRKQARLLADQLAAEFTAAAADGIEIDELPGPEGLRLRRYRPADATGRLPTQLFLHGGGFIAGAVDEQVNDRLCSHRTAMSGVQIISLGYRLAPEHPFPNQIIEVRQTLAHLHAQAETFGIEVSKVGLGGNSAGASIVAAAAIVLRDGDLPPLIHQALEVPPAALPPIGESAHRYARGFGIDADAGLQEMYAGPSPVAPLASPLDIDLASLRALPPALVMVAQFDPLRDSGIGYARRLREAGVAVDLFHGAGHLHGTPSLTRTLPSAQAWQLHAAHALKRAYHDAPPQQPTG